MTFFAVFFPKTSLMVSLSKNVIGYAIIPTSTTQLPKETIFTDKILAITNIAINVIERISNVILLFPNSKNLFCCFSY